jgi:hypothetical protein
MEPLADSTPPPYQTPNHGSSPRINSSNDTAHGDHRIGTGEIPASTDSSKGLQNGMRTAASTQTPEPGAPLDPYDWDELEQRFDEAMEERQREEEGIQQDFQKLAEVSI